MTVLSDADVVLFVSQTCMGFPNVRKAWFFGSRVSGDSGPKSDFDFAFELGEPDEAFWGEFTSFLREKNPTLYSLDLIRLDKVQPEIRRKILNEGKLIYGKD